MAVGTAVATAAIITAGITTRDEVAPSGIRRAWACENKSGPVTSRCGCVGIKRGGWNTKGESNGPIHPSGFFFMNTAVGVASNYG